MNKSIKTMSILAILLIFMMATIGSAATAAENKQDSRLSALEKSVSSILSRLSALEKSVSSILTRLTTLEKKSAPYSATFGTWKEYVSCSDPSTSTSLCYSYSFVLDKDANVFVMVTGDQYGGSDTARYTSNVGIDGSSSVGPDWTNPESHNKLSISRNFVLKAGQHTVQVYSNVNDANGVYADVIMDLTISVIANQNGNIDYPDSEYHNWNGLSSAGNISKNNQVNITNIKNRKR